MNPNRLFGGGVAIGLALALPAMGDQPIYFSNAIGSGGASRLVIFGTTFGALAGSGVRNGVADGNSFVAQLIWKDFEGKFRPVGATAEFGNGSDIPPGVWHGGIRTIEGIERGTSLQLAVLVWDSAFPDLFSAKAANRGYAASQVFTFQDGLSNPGVQSDIELANFNGFQVGTQSLQSQAQSRFRPWA
jgi:hypothetical protein